MRPFFSLLDRVSLLGLEQALLERNSQYLLSDPVECLGYFCFSSSAKSAPWLCLPAPLACRRGGPGWAAGSRLAGGLRGAGCEQGVLYVALQLDLLLVK